MRIFSLGVIKFVDMWESNEESGRVKLHICQGLLSALGVLILFVAISIISGIVPFGDHSFLMFDLKRQYVDYYSYFRTILRGENNIYYSFSTTLGSGILGFYAYYLTSPFLVLLSLFPADAVPLGVSVIICLKLMLAAFIMNLFLQRFVVRTDSFSIFDQGFITLHLCSLSWAFSGFLFAHSMNMMWIDVIILFPFFVWALENIICHNRKVPFVLCLSAMLILNYYISFQVLIFSMLWTVMRLIVRKDRNFIRQVLRVFTAEVTGACIAAFLLVPTAVGLIDSPKDITQLGLRLTGKNISLPGVLSKIVSLSYDYLEPRFGYPQIFCGLLLVMLLVLYFADAAILRRQRVAMFALFSVLMTSFCLDALNLIWHAGMEPSGHPYRQAFIWVFLMISCSAKELSNIKATVSIPKVMGTAAFVVLVLILSFTGNYDHISARTMVINGLLLTAYFVLLSFLVIERKTGYRIFRFILPLLLLINTADLALNSFYTYSLQAMKEETASFYSDVVSRNHAAVARLKAGDSSFYRMENLTPRQQNDALQYGYNGVTHYSSAGMIYVRYFLQRLGYNDDGLYTSYGHDNTVAADSLLGIRYVLTDGSNAPHRVYNKIYEGDTRVYGNPYALPVAIATKGYDLSYITSADFEDPCTDMIHVPADNPFALQEEMYSRLLGKEVSFFRKADYSSSELESDGIAYYYEYKVSPVMDGELYMYLGGLLGAREGLSVYKNGEFLTTYGNAACVKVLNLGYMNAGDQVQIRVQGETGKEDFGRPIFVTEDTETLGEASKELIEREGEIKRVSSSHLKISTGDCNGLFLSVPWEPGWIVKVDGKKTEPVPIYDSLMYIPIDSASGSHLVDMVFVPEGTGAGILITAVGLVQLIYLMIKEYRHKKKTTS